jgi:hypothetical protein
MNMELVTIYFLHIYYLIILASLKHFNTRKIRDSIEMWVKTAKIIEHLTDYFTRRNIKKLIFRLLSRIFIENEVDLHTFKVMTDSNSKDYKYFAGLAIQSPKFICNIRNLTFDSYIANENILSKLMISLCSNCNSILSLYITFRNRVTENIYHN